MKKYVSIKRWRDLTDGHLYLPGEPFPFDGREIPQERIERLKTAHNMAGFALIKAVDIPDEEIPVQKEETPKTARKSRKKAT